MRAEGGSFDASPARVVDTLRRGQCFGDSILMTSSSIRIATVRAEMDSGAWAGAYTRPLPAQPEPFLTQNTRWTPPDIP